MHERRTSMAFRERVMVVHWYSVGSALLRRRSECLECPFLCFFISIEIQQNSHGPYMSSLNALLTISGIERVCRVSTQSSVLLGLIGISAVIRMPLCLR